MREALFEDEFELEQTQVESTDQGSSGCLPDWRRIYVLTRRKSLVMALLVVLSVIAMIIMLSPSYESLRRQYSHSTSRVTYIAHLGNSFQFVNDFPRVLQTMAAKQRQPIFQDSCLHGSLSFFSLPNNGNGMLKRWNTETAWNESLQLYDFGSCTIAQLLLGYDEYLATYSYSAHYKNDGKNPCFAPERGSDDDAVTDDDKTFHAHDDDDGYGWKQGYDDSQAYLEYTLASKTRSKWDYVIMNDQSLRPAVPKERQKSVKALTSIYVPMIQESKATPVLIMTHAYSRPNVNLTDIGIYSVPHFTAKIFKGYNTYKKVLSSASVPSIIAPVGLAFLTIWEEDPHFWIRLFGPDYFHPSPHGTYLQACVVFATIFGYMPRIPTSDDDVISVFATSRSMQLESSSQALPTKSEATYLRSIAQRVVLQHHRPSSFRQAYALIKDDDNA